jgi:hypothetical protein
MLVCVGSIGGGDDGSMLGCNNSMLGRWGVVAQ